MTTHSLHRTTQNVKKEKKGAWNMILSRAQLEEIAMAVTDDFNHFFFGISPEEERENKKKAMNQPPAWNGPFVKVSKTGQKR